MRDYKFRGISILTGEIVYGSLIVKGYHAWIIDDSVKTKQCMCDIKITSKPIPVDPETVGQYTGLTDKNGVEIYEGDIVRIDYNDNGDSCSEIISVSDTGKGMGFSPLNWMFTCDGCDCCTEIKSIEVIGSIHQNPELLAEGSV